MRLTPAAVLGLRALFGLFFLVLGAITLWHVVASPAPAGSKVVGGVLAAGMIVLGGARVVLYLRARRQHADRSSPAR